MAHVCIDGISEEGMKNGAVQDFYNVLTAPWTVSNMHAQEARVQSCANLMQHIEHLSCATCLVPHGREGQLSYYVWQSLNRIYFSFVLLAETIKWWRRGGNQSTLRKPLMMIFKKCHILKLDIPSSSCLHSGDSFSWNSTMISFHTMQWRYSV